MRDGMALEFSGYTLYMVYTPSPCSKTPLFGSFLLNFGNFLLVCILCILYTPWYTLAFCMPMLENSTFWIILADFLATSYLCVYYVYYVYFKHDWSRSAKERNLHQNNLEREWPWSFLGIHSTFHGSWTQWFGSFLLNFKRVPPRGGVVKVQRMLVQECA